MKYHQHSLKITTLSPLHIGNDENLTSIGEYVTTKDKINIVDSDSFITLLEKEKLINSYLDKILNDGNETRIWDFIDENKITIPYSKSLKFNSPLDFDINSNNTLELAIETNNQKYVPGSSLKGAIRSLLFLHLITNEKQDLLKKITDSIKIVFDDRDKTKKTFGYITSKVASIEETCFNNDFKYIRPEDSKSIVDNNTCIEVTKRHHLHKEIEGLDLLRECIAKDVEIKMNLTTLPNLDNKQTTLAFVNQKDLKSLFSILNSITKKIIAYEINLLTKANDAIGNQLIKTLKSYIQQIDNSKNDYAIVRLGKGKSYFYQTLIPFLDEPNQSKLLKLLHNKVEKINRNEFKISLEEYILTYPRTRVLTGNNEMFGWLKIESESFNEFGESPKKTSQKSKPNKYQDRSKKQAKTQYNPQRTGNSLGDILKQALKKGNSKN